MISNEQRKEIEETIKNEIIKTEKAIADYTEMSKPVAPENAIGRISRMDAINNKSVAAAALRQAKRKLSNLQLSLSKVNDEDFGVCVRCKRPIAIKRVMLMPQSQYCVRCAR